MLRWLSDWEDLLSPWVCPSAVQNCGPSWSLCLVWT